MCTVYTYKVHYTDQTDLIYKISVYQSGFNPFSQLSIKQMKIFKSQKICKKNVALSIKQILKDCICPVFFWRINSGQ